MSADEPPRIAIGPEEEARVHAIARPDRALLACYVFQALVTAAVLLLGLGFVVAKVLVKSAVKSHDTPRAIAQIPLAPVLGGAAAIYGLVLLGLFVRYRTLRFRFDEQGVARSWGLLFRRETFLSYERIQDIQLRRHFVERWFGIARIAIQTASAQSADETIEGIRDYELVQAFLREKMKGGRKPATAASEDDALVVLGEIRDELRALRPLVGRGR